MLVRREQQAWPPLSPPLLLPPLLSPPLLSPPLSR